MTAVKRVMSSAYMEWVKTNTHVPFNLANSGVKNYPRSGLPVDWNALTLSGPGAYGYSPLVKAIAAKEGVDEECVATAQGTSMANHLAIAATIEPEDEVLIEHPAYPLLPETAQYLGASVKRFERPATASFSIDLNLLERAVTSKTRLIVITNLHNPSCAYTDEEALRRVGEIAKCVGARVLVDEVYLDLVFENRPETAYKLGPEFIVTNSLTKVYGLSGLRCGWVVAEPKLIKKIYALNDLFGVNNPYVTDQVSCIALEHLDQIKHWAKELLDTNHALVKEFLTGTPELHCDQSRFGTVLFPRIDYSVPDLCRFLRDRYETLVTPGEFFGTPERVRIGIGGDSSLLAQALARVREALGQLTKASSR